MLPHVPSTQVRRAFMANHAALLSRRLSPHPSLAERFTRSYLLPPKFVCNELRWHLCPWFWRRTRSVLGWLDIPAACGVSPNNPLSKQGHPIH